MVRSLPPTWVGGTHSGRTNHSRAAYNARSLGRKTAKSSYIRNQQRRYKILSKLKHTQIKTPRATVKTSEAITPAPAASTPWPAQMASTEAPAVLDAELGISLNVAVTSVVEGKVRVVDNAVVNEAGADVGAEAVATGSDAPGRKIDELAEGNALVNETVGSLMGICELNIRLEITSVGEKLEGEASEKVLSALSSVLHRGSRAIKAAGLDKVDRIISSM
jgi:hypothetical protein